MKILKRPENIMFDTENPDHMEFVSTPEPFPSLISRFTYRTDWDFLSQYFKEKDGIKHPIFNAFHSSFYYSMDSLKSKV